MGCSRVGRVSVFGGCGWVAVGCRWVGRVG